VSVRRILKLGNPMLRRKCAEVEDPRSERATRVAGDLLDTLRDFRASHGYGRAIAAPQIGELVRIVVVETDRPWTLFNPKIVDRSGTMKVWDDCFSFPGLVVRLERSRKVAIEYLDSSGADRSIELEGDPAELLQHEIDHLDGVLAVDRASGIKDLWWRDEVERSEGAGGT